MTDLVALLAPIRERLPEVAPADMSRAEWDRARLLAAIDAVTGLADQWEHEFPYKANQIRTALTAALGKEQK